MSEDQINYSINIKCFEAIPFDKYPKDFTFVVNGKRYETSRIVADYLSPIIRKYHYQDETINEFFINSSIQTNENDYFSSFLELFKFDKIYNLNQTQQKYYKDYFLHLGNIDEYLRLQPNLFTDITVDNVIDRLQIIFDILNNDETKDILNINNKEDIEKLISFASSHFSEISKDKLKNLNESVIESIIKSDKIKLEDEDELLLFILDLYEKDKKYSNLFEYIQFKNAKKETIEKFIQKFSIDDINTGIWRSICKQLNQLFETNGTSERYKEKGIEIKFDGSQKFKGIMNYLNEKTGGNIHDNGTIEITSNAADNKERSPKNLVDYQNNGQYHIFQSDISSNEPNTTILFDFKDRRVQLSSYAVESCRFGSTNYCNLRNWVVEVSNDKEKWKIIDTHTNDPTLNNQSVKAVFSVNGNDDTFYRYVQIRQTGVSWYNNGYLYISRIEFFGKLME